MPSRKIIEMVPVVLLVYDLLEDGGADIRELPIEARRARLEIIAGPAGFPVSPIVEAPSWAELEALWNGSRERRVEGLMLKKRGSPYRTGRPRGDWWKWKIAPLSIDCVLVYAQRGSGRRASLYTDYTFAVWDGGELVPFAKAYSGLSDEEIQKVDAFVRRHTLERLGPVRHIEPKIVVELGFEGIQRSSAQIRVRRPLSPHPASARRQAAGASRHDCDSARARRRSRSRAACGANADAAARPLPGQREEVSV